MYLYLFVFSLSNKTSSSRPPNTVRVDITATRLRTNLTRATVPILISTYSIDVYNKAKHLDAKHACIS